LTRKAKPAEKLRNKKLVAYGTASEAEALAKLGSDYSYQGASDVMRRALALFIHANHPELKTFLRPDLDKGTA